MQKLPANSLLSDLFQLYKYHQPRGPWQLLMALVALVRLSSLVVTALVLVWNLSFRSTLLSSSSAGDAVHPDHFYSILHPIVMVIGFVVLSGEGILAHRWLAGWARRDTRKAVHLAIQGLALGFGLFGVWTKFKGVKGVLANFYTLHSWMGLICVLLFAAQFVMGFLSFWHRVESWHMTTVIVPWHIFIGLYTYGLTVTTALAGLIEKLAVLQTKHGLQRRCREATLVNALGLSLIVLCGLVVFGVVSPKCRNLKGSEIGIGSDCHRRNTSLVDSYAKDDKV